MRKPSPAILVTLVCVALLLLSACSSAAPPTPAPTPAKPAEPKPPAAATKPIGTATAAEKPSAEKPAAKPSDSTVNVKVGVVASMSDSGIFIADEKGYFKEQGINVEIVNFDSAARMVAPMAAGQIDVGAGSPSAGLYNAVARGFPVKIVADKGSTPKGFGFIALAVRKDLVDGGQVKSVADLKGRTLAVNSKATSTEIALDMALKKGGLSTKDVEVIEMPFPDMNTAMANKKLDGGVYIEPNITLGENMNASVRYLPGDESYPNQQVATILYPPDFIRNKPDVAKRWMVAYLKGVRYYNDAFAKKDAKAREEVVSTLTKTTPLKDAKLYDKIVPPGLNPDGYVNAKGVVDDFDWYVQHGQVQAADVDKVAINNIVDNSYVEYALQQLGKYK